MELPIPRFTCVLWDVCCCVRTFSHVCWLAIPLFPRKVFLFLTSVDRDECCFVRTLRMELAIPRFTCLSWDVCCCVRTFSHVCSLATPLFLYTLFDFWQVLTWAECCFVRTLLMQLPIPRFTCLLWDVCCCFQTFSHVCSLAIPLFPCKLFNFLPVLIEMRAVLSEHYVWSCLHHGSLVCRGMCAVVSEHSHMFVRLRLRSSLLSHANSCQFWLRWVLLCLNITYRVAYTTVHLFVVGCVLLCPTTLTCLFARDSAPPLWAIRILASFDLSWVLLCPNITYGVAYATVHLFVVACVLLCPTILTCLFVRDSAVPL